jgi:hypothetical protein
VPRFCSEPKGLIMKYGCESADHLVAIFSVDIGHSSRPFGETLELIMNPLLRFAYVEQLNFN